MGTLTYGQEAGIVASVVPNRCGKETIGGFPFDITARCADVTAEITNGEPHYSIGAKGLDFVAEIYRPTRLVGEITGPLTVAVTGQPSMMIAASSRSEKPLTSIQPHEPGSTPRYAAEVTT